MVKWSVLEPYAEKYSVEDVFKKFGRPISIQVVKTRKGEAVRILYETTLPEDACQYEINRKVNKYGYIYKDDDPNLFKLLKKAIKEAERG